MTNPRQPHDVLKKAREAANLSQTYVAKKCGVSQVLVSMIERGNRRPSRAVARTLVETLGLHDFDHELLIAPELRTRVVHCGTCSCKQHAENEAAA